MNFAWSDADWAEAKERIRSQDAKDKAQRAAEPPEQP
jgi:hypothetical protein